MAFSVNTNLGALQAYNALAKVNAETQKAQLRLATTKRINSVADDTSGFNVGKQMEAQVLKQKAQLNNVSSAKNYLATAESALQQINDKLNQISAKYTDAQDPMKDKTAIAKDITTLATEINSILQTTNINGSYLLVKGTGADKTAAQSAQTFDVGGASFSVDFASMLGINANGSTATGLFAKLANLTFDEGDAGSTGAVAAGNTAALAKVTGANSLTAAIQTKLTEAGWSGAQVAAYQTDFMASYNASVAAGTGVNLAVQQALTDAEATNVGANAAMAVQVDAVDTAALAAGVDLTSDATERASLLDAAGTIADHLAKSGASSADIATFTDAFMTSIDASGYDHTTDAAADVKGYIDAAINASKVPVGGTVVADGVAFTSASVNVGTWQSTILSAYTGGVSGYTDHSAVDVIGAAQDVSTEATAVRTALGRIGNLSQSVDSRSEFLTSSIANSTASISSIFDADMAAEQLNATKGNIAGQIGTAMLSQLNSAPQNLLSLFR